MSKRTWDEYRSDSEEQAAADTSSLSVGEAALSQLRQDQASAQDVQGDSGGWEVAGPKKKNKKKRKSSRPIDEHRHWSPEDGKNKYPAIYHAPHLRLSTTVKLADLQCLILYILANDAAPQWVAVQSRSKIRKVVVLMVPGLERGMFDGSIPLAKNDPNHNENEAKDAGGENADGKSPQQSYLTRKPVSPDEYYPMNLDKSKLPEPLAPLADLFKHAWPIQAPGDDRYSKLHSPMQAILSSPLPKAQEEKGAKNKGPHPPRYAKSWDDKPVYVTELLATTEQLQEEMYTIHPSRLTAFDEARAEGERRIAAKQSEKDGWLDSKVTGTRPSGASLETDASQDSSTGGSKRPAGHPTAGRKVLSLDCEMCVVEGGDYELTRITVLDWDGSVVIDELVKPEKPITDYLTRYSGITKEKLDPVTTTRADIQIRLLNMLTEEVIIVGHSLNSDFAALKMTHPFIVDTSICYPHPRGPPFKSGLKWLAQKHLLRQIQTSDQGHSPVEDALAALDLVKLKCKKGLMYGTPEASGESLFKRLGRSPKGSSVEDGQLTGAIVDWGHPRRGYGAAADVCIGCQNDEEVVAGINRAITGGTIDGEIPAAGVDFVWARLRELEAKRQFWDKSKTSDNDKLRTNAQDDSTMKADSEEGSSRDELRGAPLGAAVSKTVSRLRDLYESLPACTALIVYSGTGDPRELSRLQEMQQTFKKEYAVKKWDQLSVHWTDTEEQQMKRACRKARAGVGFVTVK